MVEGIEKLDPRLLSKELYEIFIEEDLDYIRVLGEENKVLQRIRENWQGNNWKIVEICREILFNNAKRVTMLRERIENEYSQSIKKFSSLPRGR